MKRSTRGFTLIELLVVVSVIALLMGILMPSLQKAREAAQRTLCTSNCRQTGIGMHMYAQANDGLMVPMRPGINTQQPGLDIGLRLSYPLTCGEIRKSAG